MIQTPRQRQTTQFITLACTLEAQRSICRMITQVVFSLYPPPGPQLILILVLELNRHSFFFFPLAFNTSRMNMPVLAFTPIPTSAMTRHMQHPR